MGVDRDALERTADRIVGGCTRVLHEELLGQLRRSLLDPGRHPDRGNRQQSPVLKPLRGGPEFPRLIETAPDAFLIQNSFGPTWGQNGRFWMAYSTSASCQKERHSTSPNRDTRLDQRPPVSPSRHNAVKANFKLLFRPEWDIFHSCVCK